MAVLMPDRLAGAVAYRDALKHRDLRDFDGADACHFTPDSSSARSALADASLEHPEWRFAAGARTGEKVAFGGQVIAEIPGMGKVYDWTRSPWTPTNGGRIKPLIYVDHIPVVPNKPGIADFIRLRDVLVAQGLMVQNATDSSGNVALYTPMNFLCYQARGANSFSAGCEHMHYLTSDPWTRRQINAAAYLHWRARENHGIRNKRAALGAGNGVVRVLSRGYTTHKDVSHYAGYNDRSDPGLLFEAEYDRIRAGVRFFDKHRSFKGF